MLKPSSNGSSVFACKHSMKKRIFIVLLVSIGLTSCETEKKYSGYKESDFYEAQGVVTSVQPTGDPFDLPVFKDITFKYYISDSTQILGKEKNVELAWAKEGVPMVVLVHKENERISFYGRFGLKDSLNFGEQRFVQDYVENLFRH